MNTINCPYGVSETNPYVCKVPGQIYFLFIIMGIVYIYAFKRMIKEKEWGLLGIGITWLIISYSFLPYILGILFPAGYLIYKHYKGGKKHGNK